jgi:hypothetical protein
MAESTSLMLVLTTEGDAGSQLRWVLTKSWSDT